MSPKANEGLSAFAALCLFALTIALMLGIKLAFSALDAVVRDVTMAEASRHVAGHLAALTLVQLLAMATVVLAGLKLSDPETPLLVALHLRPIRSSSLLLCLLAGACLQLPLAELANLLHHYVFGPDSLEDQLARQALLEAQSPLEGAIVVLCLVALVPLAEELMFRGLFLFGMAQRYGRGMGLLLSACLFGLIHFQVVPAVYATSAGLVLGGLALWTESIWSSIALHAAVNAVPVLLPESLFPLHGFNVPSEAPEHLPVWLVLPSLALACGFLLWVRRLEAAEVEHE